jgi:hypothetical protein
MKNTNPDAYVLISILITFISISFFSCSKEEADPIAEEQQTEARLIRVTGEEASPQTKTTFNDHTTSWIAGDFVGIYCP